MLENLLFSINVVLPVFIMILLGFLGVRFGVATREMMAKLARITFTWFLSVKIFLDVYEADLASLSNLRMTGFCMLASVIAFAVVWALAARFLRRKESVGAFVHCSFRSSITVLGMALIKNLAGDEGVAVCAPLLVGIIITYNVLAVLCLTKFEKGMKAGPLILSTARKIATNPLILAVVLGLGLNLLGVDFPTLIRTPLGYLGDLAVPLSLLCIGAALDPGRVRGSLRYALLAACIKTFGLALAVVPAAVLAGFRGTELAAIGFVFTLANPSACYVMTEAMDGDGELAASATVLSTLLSVFTVTLLLYLLRSFRLI